VWATGHHRNGVLLAPMTAAAVASIVTGEAPPEAVEPFAPARFAARMPA
jgi:glycine oxidase